MLKESMPKLDEAITQWRERHGGSVCLQVACVVKQNRPFQLSKYATNCKSTLARYVARQTELIVPLNKLSTVGLRTKSSYLHGLSGLEVPNSAISAPTLFLYFCTNMSPKHIRKKQHMSRVFSILRRQHKCTIYSPLVKFVIKMDYRILQSLLYILQNFLHIYLSFYFPARFPKTSLPKSPLFSSISKNIICSKIIKKLWGRFKKSFSH